VAEREIYSAEERIGRLPGDYREFLGDLGWLEAGHYEIFGLGDDVPMHMDLIGMTLDERANFHLPGNLIPIMNSGGGDLYCFDCSGSGKPGVLLWEHDSSPRKGISVVGESFSSWLLERLSYV
jgi:SUKH superfamily protein